MQTLFMAIVMFVLKRLEARGLETVRKYLAPPPPPDAEYQAVKRAFATVGLDVSTYCMEYDLLAAGKFTDVLHHAARELKRVPGQRTVADVVDILKRLES